MTDSTEIKSSLARTLVMGVVALGIVLMFGSSLLYRFSNPDLQKQMRPQAPAGMGQAAMGQGGAGENGMPAGMMDMDGVREMMAGLEQRIEADPGDVEALLQLANIYLMRQDKATAMAYLDKAATGAGEDRDALMQLSKIYFDLDEVDSARTTIEAILAAHPEDMFAHFNLGVILKYRQDDKAAADEHFRIVADGDHNFEELRTEAKKELQ